MKFVKRERFLSSVFYIYDPIPLDKVALDVLKGAFGAVESDPNSEFIFVESVEPKRRAQILTARLDFVDESGDFENGAVEALKILLRAMPPINVKGLGTTLECRAEVEDQKNAGIYVTQKFLASYEELSQKLKAPIFASQHRFTYGDTSNFFDVRVTPVQMAGEKIQLQLRKHKDTNLADSDRIITETLSARSEATAEFERLVDLL